MILLSLATIFVYEMCVVKHKRKAKIVKNSLIS